MKVLVCDDHAMFADSLALVLRHAGHTVVGVAYTPDDAIRLLGQVAADICLIDLFFPDGSALDRILELRAAAPATRFVLLSGHVPPEVREAGRLAGVAGFADKGRQPGDIVRLLARVHAGEMVAGAPAADRPPPRRRPGDAHRLADHLTPREREVLGRLVRGENISALAKGLRIAQSTARSHVQGVLTKLGVHSQREAVVCAARYGLVDLATGEWLLPEG